jgi:hypothetical protein
LEVTKEVLLMKSINKNVRKLEDLDFYLLNTQNPPPHEGELVEKAFHFWRSSWEKTFQSLDEKIEGRLPSDDFLSRQVIALFYLGEPIGLLFSHTVGTSKSQLAHSYFKQYPSKVINAIVAELKIKQAMVLSYMTCHLEWRKSVTNVPVSELLFSLGVKIFERTKLEYLIACTRKNVGVSDITYRHGATKIAEGITHNVDVDYIYITKQSKQKTNLLNTAKIADILWNKMESRNVIPIKTAA